MVPNFVEHSSGARAKRAGENAAVRKYTGPRDASRACNAPGTSGNRRGRGPREGTANRREWNPEKPVGQDGVKRVPLRVP